MLATKSQLTLEAAKWSEHRLHKRPEAIDPPRNIRRGRIPLLLIKS
jgi:hypothetical protein